MSTAVIFSFVFCSHNHVGLYDVCNKWISFTPKKSIYGPIALAILIC